MCSRSDYAHLLEPDPPKDESPLALGWSGCIPSSSDPGRCLGHSARFPDPERLVCAFVLFERGDIIAVPVARP